jgi:hypothetical protein
VIITDVPNSGIYYQQGAIVQIVVELIDAETDLPVQLQAAMGLSVSVLYPDLVTSQTFSGTLYTDGSDGKIAYTTRNDGSTIDLSQVGLYQMQGNATIGGVMLPPSYATDFYVLTNVLGISSLPVFNSTAMLFYDSSGIRWALTISPSGVQSVALQPALPANFIYFHGLVMKDPAGVFWAASMSLAGVLTWAPGGSFTQALSSFSLNDSNGRSWLFTIDESGVLQAA